VVSDPSQPGQLPAADEVPSAVLDELRLAFGAADPETEVELDETAPTPPPAPRATIVIGGADELPDPVYLDEAIAASGRVAGPADTPGDTLRDTPDDGPRSTILIGGEADAAGVFDAVEPPKSSMDPRLRERRIAVKRAKGRKRLFWVVGITAAVVAVVLVIAVFASTLFAVDQIQVQGATYTAARNAEELQAVLDSIQGKPVLLIDTAAAERQLEQIPWVERAFVRTDFPNRVFIDVRERQPLATFQGSDKRYRVIDRDGRVLDVLDGRPADYLLIVGVGPDVDPGSFAGAAYGQAAQLAGALPAELRAITESISVDPTTGDLGMTLVGGVDVRLGTFDRLDAKLARLLQQVRNGLEGVDRIDVSSTDAVVTPSA
jgi:cell division protein FtsQ